MPLSAASTDQTNCAQTLAVLGIGAIAAAFANDAATHNGASPLAACGMIVKNSGPDDPDAADPCLTTFGRGRMEVPFVSF